MKPQMWTMDNSPMFISYLWNKKVYFWSILLN